MDRSDERDDTGVGEMYVRSGTEENTKWRNGERKIERKRKRTTENSDGPERGIQGKVESSGKRSKTSRLESCFFSPQFLAAIQRPTSRI